jgi:alpha-L-fucosidase
MWYDVPQRFDSVRGQGVINTIREVQPGILVNDRTGAKGDFDTPEQRLGSFQHDRPWETCMTIAQQWAWKPEDKVKSMQQCLHSLIRSAGGDGNLLFNVGPKPDGTIEPLQIERLKEMGKWLKKNGYSIYGTRGGPFKPTDWGVSTRKGNKIYLHILNLPGNSLKIVLPDIGMDIKSCTVNGKENADYYREKGEIVISLENHSMDIMDTIIEIEVAGDAMKIPPVEVKPITVSFKKPVTCSSNQEPRWIKQEWIDINAVTNGDWSGDFWSPAEDDAHPWLEIDLGSMMKVKGAIIYERGNNIGAYEILYKTGEDWKTLYTGNTIGEKAVADFPETELQQVRLLISDFSALPGTYEITLF